MSILQTQRRAVFDYLRSPDLARECIRLVSMPVSPLRSDQSLGARIRLLVHLPLSLSRNQSSKFLSTNLPVFPTSSTSSHVKMSLRFSLSKLAGNAAVLAKNPAHLRLMSTLPNNLEFVKVNQTTTDHVRYSPNMTRSFAIRSRPAAPMAVSVLSLSTGQRPSTPSAPR